MCDLALMTLAVTTTLATCLGGGSVKHALASTVVALVFSAAVSTATTRAHLVDGSKSSSYWREDCHEKNKHSCKVQSCIHNSSFR